jgi:hypothetical protein
VCVIGEDLSLLGQEKVRHELARLLTRLEPCQEPLQRGVESTCNGYGVVAGLQQAGDPVGLAHI